MPKPPQSANIATYSDHRIFVRIQGIVVHVVCIQSYSSGNIEIQHKLSISIGVYPQLTTRTVLCEVRLDTNSSPAGPSFSESKQNN